MGVFKIVTFQIQIGATTHDFSSMVVKIERSADKLDKYAQRTLDGDIKREVIGTYVNYKLSFGNNIKDKNKYNEMFLDLINPVDFVTITLPANGTTYKTYSFDGYIANVKDSIIYLSEQEQIYEGLECDIVSKKPTWKSGNSNPIWV